MTKIPYLAKPVNEEGLVNYTDEENATWKILINRQLPLVQNYAATEYLDGLQLIKLPMDYVPQLPDVNRILNQTTGWSLHPVPALIPNDVFFSLLSEKKFPLATFIRRREDVDYIQEPDIFHELFGHSPLLTNPAYAAFTEQYGKLALKASPEHRDMLARLYWFTIEFGLIQTPNGLRTYGGGILSSKTETVYCIESPIPKRQPFDVVTVLRTPYRIDILQPIYFFIENFEDLFQILEINLIEKIKEAEALGMFAPVYTVDDLAGDSNQTSGC